MRQALAKISPRNGESALGRQFSWRPFLIFGNLADVFLRVQRRIRWLFRSVAIRRRRETTGGGFETPQFQIDSFLLSSRSVSCPSGRGDGSVQAVN
jgi:hypothetical protein